MGPLMPSQAKAQVDVMKWILVVLIGGVTPVQTDVQFVQTIGLPERRGAAPKYIRRRL
jgi:hypothetical protein